MRDRTQRTAAAQPGQQAPPSPAEKKKPASGEEWEAQVKVATLYLQHWTRLVKAAVEGFDAAAAELSEILGMPPDVPEEGEGSYPPADK